MSILVNEILTVGEFLQNKNLCIPQFQRPYKWTVRNVIQLLDDIERFKVNDLYRIGTIVIYKEIEEDESYNYNIVDGQQRTITFLLIIKVILSNKFNEVRNKDLKDILYILKEQAFNPKFQNDQSKLNIQNNYREIERKIATVDESFIDFFLNKCEITHFVIDDISEAFQFFDSQNARGKDLEPHDLLKAFHLREIESSNEVIDEYEVADLVKNWEEIDLKELSFLFADFLYRVRGWSKGNSSRYFTKKDTSLFKGINLSKIDNYPYTEILKIVDNYIIKQVKNKENAGFPFQLDQTIINGKYFFKMVTHYKNVFDNFEKYSLTLSDEAQFILSTLNKYDGRNRTGDKYVRMMFKCALLYYIDKFGSSEISKALEKIFIWAYSLRLNYQSLQLATVDNYVINELNLFKKIREAIYKEEITTLELPIVEDGFESDKTADIKEIFIKMKYYANSK